ncbi:MAG TPA: hypothetical protein VF453_03675 [Burkholderiaceae bacterium]
MQLKPAFSLTPLVLCLAAGSAHADLSPYSFGASETIQHQSNIDHGPGNGPGDWLSTTELRGGLDQPLGRDELKANVAIDFNRYKNFHRRNATGYLASTEFDWSLPADLSGSFGAETRRRQYVYGLNGEALGGSGGSDQRNLETDNHFYARGQIGGESRWTLYGGLDATNRRYSLASFSGNDERQWSGNVGTRYATSPDLSFSLQASYSHGEYPNFQQQAGGPVVDDTFSMRSYDLVTNYVASGNSKLDASVGFTTQTSDIQSARHFVNGSLNWTWTPPSHFNVRVGLARDSDADTDAVNVSFNPNGINGRSINNVAHADIGYELTAKVSLDLLAQYTQRKYSNAVLPVLDAQGKPQVANGTNNTRRVYLSAHYQPTRTTDLSCGAGREIRRSHVSGDLTPGYTDNTVQCVAAIDFK